MPPYFHSKCKNQNNFEQLNTTSTAIFLIVLNKCISWYFYEKEAKEKRNLMTFIRAAYVIHIYIYCGCIKCNSFTVAHSKYIRMVTTAARFVLQYICLLMRPLEIPISVSVYNSLSHKLNVMHGTPNRSSSVWYLVVAEASDVEMTCTYSNFFITDVMTWQLHIIVCSGALT